MVEQQSQIESKFKLALDKVWEWTQVASAFLIGTIVVVLLVGIIYVLFRPSGTVIEGLPDAAYARGVITFIIAVATIAIALILTVTAVQRGQSTDKEEREAAAGRFERGKQVLTILVGILGTIVGFYFGSGDDDRADVRVLRPRFEVAKLVEGHSAILSTAASGGSSPYSYTVMFDGLDMEERAGETADGWISESFDLPEVSGDQATEFTVKIIVKDSDDRSAEAETESKLENPPPQANP